MLPYIREINKNPPMDKPHRDICFHWFVYLYCGYLGIIHNIDYLYPVSFMYIFYCIPFPFMNNIDLKKFN